MLNAAVDDQLISRNPCKASSVRMPRQPKRKITPWTPAQVEAIRAGLPGQWRAIVDCGSGLGERQGEIFAMGPDEIDFLRRKVHVRRQVKRVGGRLWFALPKGGKEREVPLAGAGLAAPGRAHRGAPARRGDAAVERAGQPEAARQAGHRGAAVHQERRRAESLDVQHDGVAARPERRGHH